MKINYDGLNNADPSQVAKAVFEQLDRLQGHPQGVLCASAAITFLLLCEHFKVEPQDVFVAAKNLLMDDRQGGRHEFGAVRLFVQNEITK
jgi:hypothetical protein